MMEPNIRKHTADEPDPDPGGGGIGGGGRQKGWVREGFHEGMACNLCPKAQGELNWVKGMCKGWQGEERERMGMVEIGHYSRPPASEPMELPVL